MKTQELNEAVRDFLAAFNNEKVEINDDTVLNTVLSPTDGKGPANSRNIFKGLVIWTLNSQGFKKITLPKSWMDLTVKNFSEGLITAE